MASSPIYAVRLITEHSVGSWIVRRATNSRWSHVDILTPEGFLGARLAGGVQIRPWSYILPSRIAYGILTPKTQGAARQADAWLRQQIGESYDWTAILAMPFGSSWHLEGRWFCSELVAAWADRLGCPLQRRAMQRVSPQDVYESFAIRILDGKKLLDLKKKFGIPNEF